MLSQLALVDLADWLTYDQVGIDHVCEHSVALSQSFLVLFELALQVAVLSAGGAQYSQGCLA